MKLTDKHLDQKGGANLYYVLLGVVLTLAVLFVLRCFHFEHNDLVVHVPSVQVH